MPGDFGGPVCSCAFSLVGLHTRPRVHRAPGIPARPLHLRGGRLMANLEQAVLRDREVMSRCYSHVSTSLRGALATKQSTLASLLAEQWIASPTLAMTALGFWKLDLTVIARRLSPT